MKLFWKIFFLLISTSISAQIYAPDTTFRFSGSTFKMPEYQFVGLVASTKKYTLAQIKPAERDVNYQIYSNTALLDSTGRIITAITDGQIVPNSLTDDGFWVNNTQYYTEIDSVFYLYYFEISSRKKISYQLNLKYPVRSIIAIEHGCAIFQQIDNSYHIYDLEKGFIAKIDPSKIPTKKFSSERFYIQALRVDEEKNTWVLGSKYFTDTTVSLQLYKVKPFEELGQSNRIFEITDNELGVIGSTWQGINFFENTIIVQRNLGPFEARELIKFDLNGNYLPDVIKLPLVNNDPNTFYNFVKSSNTDYICFRVGQSIYSFVNRAGKLTSYKIPTERYYNVIIDDNKLIYIDDFSKIHVIDIPTLRELQDYKLVPFIDFRPPISYVQTLDNGDYWLGYQNPYQESLFFVKYHQNKEVLRFGQDGKKLLYLSKNDVLIQDIDKKIQKFGTDNTQILLSIKDDNIVYVDTSNAHIYANTNGGELNRYFYDGKQDLSFKWAGGEVKTEIVVDGNGKIHSLGRRFLPNGGLDTSFQGVDIQLISNGYSATVFMLKKIGDSILMMNGACSMSCSGNIYFWSENDNSIKQISGNFWEYMVKFRQITKRGSLILAGFDKVFPNLKTDSSFTIKRIYSTVSYPFYIQNPKPIDILPNHDLLITSGKELVKYSTKNNLWVEIRNLKVEISLNDSLLKSGIDLDVFSSDNSAVNLQIENVFDTIKIAYLEGNKLRFTGKEGVIKLTAKSVKGGTPFEIQFPINDWRLQNSTINIRPNDTTLYVDFKPFPITIKADGNLPLTIKTEGNGAYLKDGIIYPTGKRGFLHISVSHGQVNGYRANSQNFTFWVNQIPQKINYTGIDTLTKTYYLPERAFPFKIPIQTSSTLPIRYTLNEGSPNLSQIFHISSDSVYLNPNYQKSIETTNTGYSPIWASINGFQAGNNVFQTAYFNLNIQLILSHEEPLLAPLDVFPNPFDTNINVYCPNKESITEAFIYDNMGRLIKRYSVTQNDYWQFQFPFYSPQMEVVKLFTEDIPKGNYLLVFTANNQKFTKRIVK